MFASVTRLRVRSLRYVPGFLWMTFLSQHQVVRALEFVGYAHWISESDAIPSWPEAYEHLQSEGRLSRVAHPSRNHEAREFARPRLSPLIGQDLKPVRSSEAVSAR